MCNRLIAAAVTVAILSFHQTAGAAAKNLPQPDHVVVVILENHSFSDIINPSQAPYIYSLAAGGALFVNAFAVSHPSEPNYLALFSGSTQGIRDDDDYTIDAPTLAGKLQAATKSFIGYVERGSPREHNPWSLSQTPAQ